MVFGNKKTIEGITKSLNKVQDDLSILDNQKNSELTVLEEKRKDINTKIIAAENEKTRGDVIRKQIIELLGDKKTPIKIDGKK